MLESYRRVFAHQGSFAFSSTGLLARLPMAMMTLGIVILVSELTDSYALAGQISAAFVIGNAALAIPQGRAADRIGQTPVLAFDAVIFALATGSLIVAITDDWSSPAPHLLAALAGASMPQVGSMVRSRWTHVVNDDQERHTAFAVEAIVDEIVFVAGPALVPFLSTLYAPQTGLLVALTFGTIGTVGLATQRRTAPPAHPRTTESSVDPFPWALITPIGVAALALGALFGALEVATVAVAEDAGQKAASGALLAVFSAGSLIAGVVSGALTWKASALRRFQVGIALLAAGLLVLPFITPLILLGAALLVVGSALAPTLISIVSLLEASTPRSRLTEAMAVFQTGISAGLAPGAFLTGLTADNTQGPAAYWVAVGAGVLSLTAALACRAAPVHATD